MNNTIHYAHRAVCPSSLIGRFRRIIQIFVTIFVVHLYSLSAVAQQTVGSDDTSQIDSDAHSDLGEFDLPEGFEIEEIPEFETTVEDTGVAASAASTIINQKQIAQAHASSAARLMQLVPGVEIVQHGSEGKGHQIFLRGFDAAHGSDVEVTLEGVPLNEPSHIHGPGYVDLYGIIPEAVQSIDVHMGSFLPNQGNFSTGGSMDFQLAVPDDFGSLTAGTDVDNYGKFRGVTVLSPPGKEHFIAADVVADNGFAEGREAKRGAFIGKLTHHTANGTLLSALVSLQSARFETPGTMKWSDVEKGAADFYDIHHPHGDGLSDRILGRTGIEIKKPDAKLSAFTYGMVRHFSLAENFTGRLYYPNNGDRKKQTQSGATGGMDVRLQKKLPLPIPVKIKSGANFRMDTFHQRETQVLSNDVEWRVNRSNKIHIYQLGSFAGIKVSPTSWMDLFPSVRFDAGFYDVHDHQTTFSRTQHFQVVSPRIAASFPVNSRFVLFADYGKGFRFPEARSILYTADTSDEDLKLYKGGTPAVSTSHSVETGLEIKPAGWLQLKLVGFGIFMEREMVFDHVSNLTVEMDGTHRIGGEFDISVLPVEWISFNSTTTYVHARFNRSGHPIPNVPTLMGTASINAGKAKGPHGGADLFWMGRHHLAHGATIKGYAKVGLDGGYRFKNVDVTAVIENVFNTQVMEGTYHFASWFDGNTPRSMIPEIQYIAGNPFTLRLLLTIFL